MLMNTLLFNKKLDSLRHIRADIFFLSISLHQSYFSFLEYFLILKHQNVSDALFMVKDKPNRGQATRAKNYTQIITATSTVNAP